MKNNVSPIRDIGYRFKDRDADMDWICQQIIRSELSTYEISNIISRKTGSAYSVSPTTMNKWLNGTTKKPQNYTLTWVAYALGYEKTWGRLK